MGWISKFPLRVSLGDVTLKGVANSWNLPLLVFFCNSKTVWTQPFKKHTIYAFMSAFCFYTNPALSLLKLLLPVIEHSTKPGKQLSKRVFQHMYAIRLNGIPETLKNSTLPLFILL